MTTPSKSPLKKTHRTEVLPMAPHSVQSPFLDLLPQHTLLVDHQQTTVERKERQRKNNPAARFLQKAGC